MSFCGSIDISYIIYHTWEFRIWVKIRADSKQLLFVIWRSSTTPRPVNFNVCRLAMRSKPMCKQGIRSGRRRRQEVVWQKSCKKLRRVNTYTSSQPSWLIPPTLYTVLHYQSTDCLGALILARIKFVHVGLIQPNPLLQSTSSNIQYRRHLSYTG